VPFGQPFSLLMVAAMSNVGVPFAVLLFPVSLPIWVLLVEAEHLQIFHYFSLFGRE
jgi:hypothetical protein